MRIQLLLILFVIISKVAFAQADDSTPKVPLPPPGPLIQTRAPDFAAWTITSAPTGATAGQNQETGPSTPKNQSSKTITKTHDIIRVARIDENGQQWTTWCMGKLEITLYPNGKDGVTLEAGAYGSTFLYIDFSATDFSDFRWITRNSYSGTESFAGKDCLVFHGKYDVNSGAVLPVDWSQPHQNISNPATAYIDVKTRLPVALQTALSSDNYVFSDPPTAMLQLPVPIQTALKLRAAGNPTVIPRRTLAPQ